MMKQALLTLRHATLPALVVAAAAGGSAISAHAALFGDDEARRAIIELRQRVDSLQQSQEQTRRSLLDLQSQIESLKSDQAKLRGQNEQLTRDASELQRGQNICQGLGRAPAPVRARQRDCGRQEFTADRNEQQEFEQALGMFRSGKFPEAGQAFAAFLRQPQERLRALGRFWLGNSQYATRDYKNAIANFRSVMTSAHACSCARSGAVHRQLSGRTQGHQGSAQDPGRAAAGLSELGSRRDCQSPLARLK
jgi:TolA-binding protein